MALVAVICLSPLLILVTVWLHFANRNPTLSLPQREGTGNQHLIDPNGERAGWLKRWLEPVFFFQERPGLHGKIFKIIKFKSMTDEKDENGNLLPNDKRITPIGAFIRKTSLDELPQLFNVLKGDMSLIGPRPLMPRYLGLYNTEQMRRHDVRPGITGWAQVNGRNSITWTHKFELDVWYVDHLSLSTDLKIIYLTIKNVLRRKDIEYEGNSVNSEGFNGHN